MHALSIAGQLLVALLAMALMVAVWTGLFVVLMWALLLIFKSVPMTGQWREALFRKIKKPERPNQERSRQEERTTK